MGAIQQVLASYGASFSPLDLAALSEWFSIESLAAVGDGNPISSWVGEKGVYTLGASGTTRPTYAADDGDGLPSAQLDGVDDAMEQNINNTVLFGATGDAYEAWFVIRLTAGATRGIFGAYGVSNQLSAQASTSIQWNAPNGAVAVTVANDMRDDAWHVLRLNKNGTNRIIALDGVTIYNASTTAGTYGNGADILFLGNYFGTMMQGAVRHMLFTTDALTAPDALALQTYLEGFV